ncbi:MAG: hypothetical protein GY777_00550 [Candidatus Brocadiaceae bacterium]|nr:hypothetical protein [Candidatus Brocadiaceae bacterium]
MRPVFPIGEGADSPIGKFANRYWKLIVLAIFHFILYLICFNENPQKWTIIAMVLGIITSIALSRTKMLKEIIKNENIRVCIICFISILPFLSFAWGINDGHATKNNKPKITVQFSKYKNIEFRYIGYAGGYFFIYNKKNNEIVMVGNKNVEKLKFLVHEKKRDLTTVNKTDLPPQKRTLKTN